MLLKSRLKINNIIFIFNEASCADVVESSISQKLHEIPVLKTVVNRQGEGCIFLPDEGSRHQAENLLSQDNTVDKSENKPNSFLPKLKVHNVDDNLDADELYE